MNKRDWMSMRSYLKRDHAATPFVRACFAAALAHMDFLEKRREARIAHDRRQRQRKRSVT